MILELSAPLAVALKGLELAGAGALDDEPTAMAALHFICDFVPERAEDADIILEIARRLLENGSGAHGSIIAAQVAILKGDMGSALAALSEAAILARSEGAGLVERLCLNLIAAPVPAVMLYRPPLPWDFETVH